MPAAPSSTPLVKLYYLATPAFAIADWLGANVRAVGLADHPQWRIGYYVVCTLAGVLLQVRPRWSGVVGLVEASSNVLLLVLAVVLPYVDAISIAAAGAVPPALPFTAGFFANFLLSGAVWVIVFQRRVVALSGLRPPTGPTS
jgi:hypothetical protein